MVDGDGLIGHNVSEIFPFFHRGVQHEQYRHFVHEPTGVVVTVKLRKTPHLLTYGEAKVYIRDTSMSIVDMKFDTNWAITAIELNDARAVLTSLAINIIAMAVEETKLLMETFAVAQLAPAQVDSLANMYRQQHLEGKDI